MQESSLPPVASSSSETPRIFHPAMGARPGFRPSPSPPSLGVTLGEIYYVLFRYKERILACGLLGILLAPLLYFLRPTPYQSEAKLLIRYVLESKTLSPSINPSGKDSRVKFPDERGEKIINTEVEILTSLDLAQQVVNAVGAEKILPHSWGSKNSNKAVWYVQKHLMVDVLKNSDVIRILFRHSDPEVAQTVLREVVNAYFKKHIEIHHAAGVLDEFLTQQTDQLRSRLAQTEEELHQAKNKAGVISLDDSKKFNAEQLARIRRDLFGAETELAENQGSLKIAQTTALQSKIAALKLQVKQIQEEDTGMDALEPAIVELQRKRDLEEANYRYFSANLEQSRFDEALDEGKVSNISLIQSPSIPFKDPMQSLKKTAIVVLGGIFCGLAWAFLIEMVFDHSVKRPIEVERSLGMRLLLSIPDVSRNGHHPLAAAAINKLSRLSQGKGHERAPENHGRRPEAKDEQVRASWRGNAKLAPFYEALRDRLVVYFEVRKTTHKPKLIALTGVSRGSGATLTAIGLAASLSETGDGNVLLVDMHPDQEAVQHFVKGKAVCELHNALSSKGKAFVQDNLYVVSHGKSVGEDISKIFPKRFANMLPELKASDYDYILFDMPLITQTSVTPRLAGFMDMVLMVIEAEKNDRDIIHQAHGLLLESKANVCAVLNKTHNYIPTWLHQDFLSES